MIKTLDDAAYELVRCAIHFSDTNRDMDHDWYYSAVLDAARLFIVHPVFEMKIESMNDYRIVVTHAAGQFTMKKVRNAMTVYNWLEDRLYGSGA